MGKDKDDSSKKKKKTITYRLVLQDNPEGGQRVGLDPIKLGGKWIEGTWYGGSYP